MHHYDSESNNCEVSYSSVAMTTVWSWRRWWRQSGRGQQQQQPLMMVMMMRWVSEVRYSQTCDDQPSVRCHRRPTIASCWSTDGPLTTRNHATNLNTPLNEMINVVRFTRPGWVRCGRGLPPPPSYCEGPGYYPRKIYENSDAKSCILVTTFCEISWFLKTTAKKLGDLYIVGPPT